MTEEELKGLRPGDKIRCRQEFSVDTLELRLYAGRLYTFSRVTAELIYNYISLQEFEGHQENYWNPSYFEPAERIIKPGPYRINLILD